MLLWSRGYAAEDIDTVINKYLKDPREVDEMYDEMTQTLDGLSKVCTVYSRPIPWAITTCQCHSVWTITHMFLGGYLHFLYQWKEEWMLYCREGLQLYINSMSTWYKLKTHKTARFEVNCQSITAWAVATSCCISDVSSQWEGAIFDPP